MRIRLGSWKFRIEEEKKEEAEETSMIITKRRRYLSSVVFVVVVVVSLTGADWTLPAVLQPVTPAASVSPDPLVYWRSTSSCTVMRSVAYFDYSTMPRWMNEWTADRGKRDWVKPDITAVRVIWKSEGNCECVYLFQRKERVLKEWNRSREKTTVINDLCLRFKLLHRIKVNECEK